MIRVIPAAQPITTAWRPKATTAPALNDAARTAPEHLVGFTVVDFWDMETAVIFTEGSPKSKKTNQSKHGLLR